MSIFWRTSLLVPNIILILVIVVQASQYDPHVYPPRGPFFEGWYTRLTDTDNERSFGVLFGRVLPVQTGASPRQSRIRHPFGRRNVTTENDDVTNDSTYPTSYIALMRSNGVASPMIVAEAFPDDADVEVTVDGKPVTENPALTSPASFRWVARPYGYFNVTPRSTAFSFTVDGVTFSGNLSAPVLWDSTGRGPEGWLTTLPLLPVHWFVYSLGSLGTYTWSNASSTQRDRAAMSGKAHVHQEKNWGEGFPSAWVWTQAYNRSANASFAGSFGVVSPLGAVDIPGHLFGYRDFARGLSLDFRSDNSVTKLQLDPCGGNATITVRSVRHIVEIDVRSPTVTLDSCIRGPMESGFVPILVETYEATIRVIIHERGIFRDRLIEDRTFYHAAFEFGRDFLCPNNPCRYRT